MLPPSFIPGKRPPISNAERQREFRERNPGYYGRLQARRRAGLPSVAQLARDAQLSQRVAMAPKPPLALPAPIERIEIPGVTIPFTMEQLREPAESLTLEQRSQT